MADGIVRKSSAGKVTSGESEDDPGIKCAKYENNNTIACPSDSMSSVSCERNVTIDLVFHVQI